MTKYTTAIAFTISALAVVLATKVLASRERPAPAPPARQDTPTATPRSAPELKLVLAREGNSARYMVREQLVGFDLPSDAIGATQDLSGSIAFDAAGNVIPGGSRIDVSLASLRSDSDRRDGFVRSRLLETDRFPRAELTLTRLQGIGLPLPTSGTRTFSLDGNLTVRGVTRPTTWSVQAAFTDSTVTGTANTRFTFADFALTQPRVPVLLSVSDTIRLEYQFTLRREPS